MKLVNLLKQFVLYHFIQNLISVFTFTKLFCFLFNAYQYSAILFQNISSPICCAKFFESFPDSKFIIFNSLSEFIHFYGVFAIFNSIHLCIFSAPPRPAPY